MLERTSRPQQTLVLTSDSVLSADSSVLFAAPTSSAGLAAQPDVRRNRQSLSVLIRRVSARQGADLCSALCASPLQPTGAAGMEQLCRMLGFA